MDLPFNIWLVFVSISLLISLLGIYLGFKKIAGAPFITIIGGIFLFAVTVMTVNIEGVLPDNKETIIQNTTNHMNQPTRTGGTTLRNGQNIFIGEYLADEGSLLAGKEINQATFRLDRIGANVGGFVYFGVWGHNTPPTLSNAHYVIGQMRANDTDADISFYTLTRNDTKTHILQVGEVVGVFYDNGDASNNLTVDSNATASSFDNSSTNRRVFTELTNTWTESTISDMTGKISLVKTQLDVDYDKYAFNQNEIWAYMIFISAVIMLIGGVFQKQDWA